MNDVIEVEKNEHLSTTDVEYDTQAMILDEQEAFGKDVDDNDKIDEAAMNELKDPSIAGDEIDSIKPTPTTKGSTEKLTPTTNETSDVNNKISPIGGDLQPTSNIF